MGIPMENNVSLGIKQALGYIGNIGIVDIIDIGIMAVVIYFAIGLIRRAQTYKVFQGLLFLFLALWLSDEIGLHVVNFLLRNAVEVGLLALIVLFQPEIRRFLEKLGAGRPVRCFLATAAIFRRKRTRLPRQFSPVQICLPAKPVL